jgi:cytochrome d ubiquinol oxidase subunit II
MLASLVTAWQAHRRRFDRRAFLATSALLASLLAATAAALYPVILRSTIDARYDVTAASAATGHRALVVGLTWWIPALVLAVAYFAYLFRSFAGKVRASHH